MRTCSAHMPRLAGPVSCRVLLKGPRYFLACRAHARLRARLTLFCNYTSTSKRPFILAAALFDTNRDDLPLLALLTLLIHGFLFNIPSAKSTDIWKETIHSTLHCHRSLPIGLSIV